MTYSNTHFPKSSSYFDYVNFLPQLLDTINTFAPISNFNLPDLATNEDLDYKQSSADNSIHLNIDDMQIAEDFQLIVSHMCMQWLSNQKIN